jgi:hypothetical protein
MSDVPPPPPVTPPPDAGAATTGGEAATNPTLEATPDVQAQLPEVAVQESADGGIELGEGGQDPTANETPDVSEAQWVEVDMPASDSPEDGLEWIGRRMQGDEQDPSALSDFVAALPSATLPLAINVLDTANVVTGVDLDVDTFVNQPFRDYYDGWIRKNAPDLAQSLDRIFGKGK